MRGDPFEVTIGFFPEGSEKHSSEKMDKFWVVLVSA